MDFREMVYITTVADLRSVTAAAKKLYISQPSLSYIISKVEQDVGVKLFDRKNYPLTLTYAGEKFVDAARKILLLNDNLRRELVDIGLGEKGKISFGIPTERAGYMLPAVIREFQNQYPLVEVRLVEAKADELIQSLMRDEIDFFVLPQSTGELPAGVQAELVYKERLLLVAGPGVINCDPGNVKTADLDEIKHLPFIQLKKGHSIRKKTDSVFKQHKISPHVVMEVSSCITAVQLAASGLGITIVPQRAVEVLGGMDKFNCYQYSEEPDTWDVDVVYKEDVYLDRAERFFIDLMKRTFGKAKEELK